MRDILKQVGKADREVIDRDSVLSSAAGRDQSHCPRTYIKAGDTFVTDIKVLDARTKSSLKSANSKGVGVESILTVNR